MYAVTYSSQQIKNKIVRGENYELRVANRQKAVLVLFPCFGCDIDHTIKEAKFLESIDQNLVSVLLLNFNQKLFLKDSEKAEYSQFLNSIFNQHNVDKNQIHIGGFSSGGNLALLLSNYLIETDDPIQPKGVLAIDSPVDLEKLYFVAQHDLEGNADEEAVEEAKFLTNLLEESLGQPDENLEPYKIHSPYIISKNSTGNIKYLKDIKTLFYCEPDLNYQKIRKNRTYEDLNAYQLEKLNDALVNLGNNRSEIYKTDNRGFRANGEKNPHSWSLVDPKELMFWLLQ